jgi:hypothetical protein
VAKENLQELPFNVVVDFGHCCPICLSNLNRDLSVFGRQFCSKNPTHWNEIGCISSQYGVDFKVGSKSFFFDEPVQADFNNDQFDRMYSAIEKFRDSPTT